MGPVRYMGAAAFLVVMAGGAVLACPSSGVCGAAQTRETVASCIGPAGREVPGDAEPHGERNTPEKAPGADELRRMWIFFDARRGGGAESQAAVSERARARMRRRGSDAAQGGAAGRPCPRMISRLDPLVERIRHRSFYFNAVSVDVTIGNIPALLALPGVARIEPVVTYRRKRVEVAPESSPPLLTGSSVCAVSASEYGSSYGQLAMIQALELLVAGYNGSGAARGGEPVMIGVLDTGFRLEHRALRHIDVHAQYDFVNFDTVTANEPGDPPGQDFHGTIVLGAIAGLDRGNFAGPAWGARYLLAKTEIIGQEIRIEEDNWIAGLEWCDSIGADIVTSSLGYMDWYTPEMLDGNTALCTQAADMAASRGIVVCNAVGNFGPPEISLIAPADARGVIAVGGVYGDGSLWHASSRGPTADGRIKPDLVAQAVQVVSISYHAPGEYARYSGTSLATPLVAGLCAQLLEIHPDWSPLELRAALVAHASRADAPDNGYGHGIPRGLFSSGLSCSDAPDGLAVSHGYPNPFNSTVRFDLRTERLARVSARVYDARGGLVRRLFEADLMILDRSVEWDGRDDRGRLVASGVYWVEFSTASLRRSLKIVHLR